MTIKKIGAGIFMILIFLSGKSYAQTIVKVMADQPEKMELTLTDSLFSRTASAYVFGQSMSLSGGTGPFSYTWLRDNTVVGNTTVLEIPSSNMVPGTYSVIIKDAKNCTVSRLTTGTDDISAESMEVNVYPVPADDFIFIDPGDIPQELTITITNTSGRTLLKKVIHGLTRIEINYPQGIYFIRLQDEAGRLVGTQKFFVL